MNCPACNKIMVEEDFGGVMVDVCQDGCKSIWFDWMELIRLDEENEGFGEALTAAMNQPIVNDENRDPLKCPKCDLIMHAHKYQSSKEVNVDECYQCGGFFLDSGELKVIKESFLSEEEREQYVQKLLSEMPEYQEAKEDLKKEKARTAAVYNMTKYIRLSHYMNRKK